MKLQGKISFFINREITTIEIEDDKANTVFLNVKLTPEQLVACLSRQGYVDCSLEVQGLDRVGKTHEHQNYEFEIPDNLNGSSHEKELQAMAQKQLDVLGDGWIAEGYFSSQHSFFKKEGKPHARCTIRRYI